MGRMTKGLVAFAVIMVAVALSLPQPAYAEKKLYIGGSMAMTGAFAEDGGDSCGLRGLRQVCE